MEIANKKQNRVVKSDNGIILGAVRQMDTAYSTHFEKNFNVNGTPSEYDLESIFNAPQDHIDQIIGYSKYCYRKFGVIMRVINIIRDFGGTELVLSYPKKESKTKEIIAEYNKRINVDQLIKEMIYELALTGNLACYDRDGQRVDIYPVNQIEVVPLVKNNKQIIAYKIPMDTSFTDYDENIQELIKDAYPSEILEAKLKNKDKAILDADYAYFTKINASQYERYGIPVTLPAFEDLAHKSLLKEAERSTANAIIEKVLCIHIGDEKNQPSENLIEQYNDLFEGLTGSVRVTLPYYVKMSWVEPEISVFGKDKFVQVDTDILNTLGVSLTLIRGEGAGSYSDGLISFAGLTRTIDSIRGQIPEILNGLYRKELERNNIKADNAPVVKFSEVIIDKDTKLNLVKELFQNAGLPYKVLFEEFGYDYDHIRLIREDENNNNVEEIFKLHSQPFQGEQTGDDGKGGVEKKAGMSTTRKTDKNRANNNQPRPNS